MRIRNKRNTDNIYRLLCNLCLPDVTGLFVVAFLLILTVQPIEEQWSKTELVLSGLIPFIMAMGIAILLYQKHHQNFRLGWIDGLLLLWGGYYFGRIWLGAEFPCATIIFKSLSLGVLYISLRILFFSSRNKTLISIVLIVSLLICGSYEALYGIIQIIQRESHSAQFCLTGTFHNPGPYSAYLMLSAVICMAWRPKERYINMFRKGVLILTLITLPTTWSRAAFIAVIILSLWIYRKVYWRWRYIIWGVLIIVAAGFYILKQGSANGRLLIWQASLNSWWESPFWGVGIGGFPKAYSDGIANLYSSDPELSLFASAGVTEYAFNDLLKIMIEQGTVGLLLSFSLICIGMYRLYRCSQPLYYGMLSIFIFSLFSYPMELFPYQLIAVLVLAYAASTPSNRHRFTVCKWWVFPVGLYGIYLALGIHRQIKEQIELRREYLLFAHMEDVAFIKDFYELLPYGKDNPVYLFEFGKLLRTFGRYTDSNAMLRQGSCLSSDPMFHILIGNNHRDLQHYEEAESAYQEAFSRMPNRVYPLFQLMNLYEEMGELVKMQEMANKVVDIKEKIVSPATKEMKGKAREIKDKI